MPESPIYFFGQFRWDTNSHQLFKGSVKIHLPEKQSQVLEYFLRNPGKLIYKDELIRQVWHSAIVEEGSLRLAISGLRKQLNDDKHKSQFIATVSKCGYRFSAEVTLTAANALHFSEIQTHCLRYVPKLTKTSDSAPTQLKPLQQAFEEAQAGNRRVVFWEELPFINQNNMLDYFLGQINNENVAVFQTRCLNLSCKVQPFFYLLETLEGLCQKPSGNALIECLRYLAPTWLTQMQGGFRAPFLKPKENAPYDYSKMLREGTELFERLGIGITLVLILENAQWSDVYTLDLFALLAHRKAETRLLIILKYQTDHSSSVMQQIHEMSQTIGKQHLGINFMLDDAISV